MPSGKSRATNTPTSRGSPGIQAGQRYQSRDASSSPEVQILTPSRQRLAMQGHQKQQQQQPEPSRSGLQPSTSTWTATKIQPTQLQPYRAREILDLTGDDSDDDGDTSEPFPDEAPKVQINQQGIVRHREATFKPRLSPAEPLRSSTFAPSSSSAIAASILPASSVFYKSGPSLAHRPPQQHAPASSTSQRPPHQSARALLTAQFLEDHKKRGVPIQPSSLKQIAPSAAGEPIDLTQDRSFDGDRAADDDAVRGEHDIDENMSPEQAAQTLRDLVENAYDGEDLKDIDPAEVAPEGLVSVLQRSFHYAFADQGNRGRVGRWPPD